MSLKQIEVTDKNIIDFHRVVGFNVKRIRQQKGATQLELAYAIGHKSVSLISVAEINHNKRHFNLEQLYRIALVLDVDICEFFKPLDNSK